MITAETASAIWHCYREIECAEKLLADMAKAEEKYRPENGEPTLRDAFGRAQHLQFGIPSGQNSHTLYRVSPGLAKAVINAHIANKRAELAEANERARVELGEPYTMP